MRSCWWAPLVKETNISLDEICDASWSSKQWTHFSADDLTSVCVCVCYACDTDDCKSDQLQCRGTQSCVDYKWELKYMSLLICYMYCIFGGHEFNGERK